MHCGQCTHWNQDLGEITGAGRCERFPPLQGWAQTRADDGCGEFLDQAEQPPPANAEVAQPYQLIPVDPLYTPAYLPDWLGWAIAALALLAVALLAYNSIW